VETWKLVLAKQPERADHVPGSAVSPGCSSGEPYPRLVLFWQAETRNTFRALTVKWESIVPRNSGPVPSSR